MATLTYELSDAIGGQWDPATFRGYANGKAAMISLGVPFDENDNVEITYSETGNVAIQSGFISRIGSVSANAQAANTVWKYSPLTYVFPYAPVETSLSELSYEYVEIDRPSAQSLIAPKSPRLMKASFTCLIANRDSHGLISVESDLQHLAEMARRESAVAFSGFGAFFCKVPTDQVYRLWRITDMSISVRRRNPVTGDITQAEVQFSITEDANPGLASMALPRIVYTPYIVKRRKKPTPKKDNANGGGSGYAEYVSFPGGFNFGGSAKP
jgi:hypothetical protein